MNTSNSRRGRSTPASQPKHAPLPPPPPSPIVDDVDDLSVISNGNNNLQQQQQNLDNQRFLKQSCDSDEAESLCSITDLEHLRTADHIKNLTDYLQLVWGLQRPNRYLKKYGLEAVSEAANDLSDGLEGPFLDIETGQDTIKSRPRFAHWSIQQAAAEIADFEASRPQEFPTNKMGESIRQRA